MYHGFIAYSAVWQTSAGRAVENFMDFSHFPWVHEGLLGSRARAVVTPHDVVEADYGLRYEFDTEPMGLRRRDDEIVHWEYDLRLPFTIHIKKVTPHGEMTLFSLAASPIAPKATRLYVWVVANFGSEEQDRAFAEFEEKVMEQDRAIVESQRPEEIPIDLREELHLKVPDAAAIAYRRKLAEIDRTSPFMP
jgi:phenylpropionate dioxygenase-like ring-hydroxylating dioxygenase large terminal subunit